MNILIMLKNNFLKLKSALFAGIGGALLLILIFTSVNDLGKEAEQRSTSISVGLIDNDNSELSKSLKLYLEKKQNMIVKQDSYENLSNLLLDRRISVIIEVPESFQLQALNGNMQNLIFTALDDYENSAFTQAYLNTFMQGADILSKSADGDLDKLKESLSNSNEFNTKLNTKSLDATTNASLVSEFQFQFTAGFFMMLIFSIGIIFSLSISKDKYSGTYFRIKATPIKPVDYIIGTSIYGLFTMLLFYSGLIIYIGIFNIDIGFPLWLAFLIFTLFSLFALGFSILLALLNLSNNAISTIILGFGTISNILGGAYFPISDEVGSIKNLSILMPNYWLMDIIRGVQENPDYNILPAILILSLYVVLIYLITSVIFANNTRKS